MKVAIFHPEALAELQEQAVFYNERVKDLGLRSRCKSKLPFPSPAQFQA